MLTPKNDMATTPKIIRQFSGEQNEDVLVWLQDVAFVKEVAGLTDEETKRTILLSLRGAALSWAAETLAGGIGQLNLESVVELIKNRFSNKQQAELSLSRFLTAAQPTSREEVANLLNQATEIFKKGYMNTIPLMQVVIKKVPSEIKGLLLQAAEAANTWDQFTKRTMEVSWISFPDATLNRVTHREEEDRSEKDYCEWHEKSGHSTKNCYFLKELRRKEKYKAERRGKESERAK